MPYFAVTLRDVKQSGITKVVHFEAPNQDVAKQAAVTKRWQAVSARSVLQQPAGVRKATVRPLKGKPLVRFCKSLGSMVRNGVSLTDALYFYADGEPDVGLKIALDGIRTRIKDGGEDAAQAFAASGRFDDMFVGIVKAGASGGVLGESFRAVAEHVETQITLQSKLKKALRMPTLAIAVIVAVFIFSQVSFIPNIEKTVLDTRLPPDPFSAFIFQISHIVRWTWPILLITIITGVCLLVFSTHARNTMLEVLMKYWRLFREMIMGFQQLLILGTMDMLISNRIGVLESIRAASRVMAKTVFESQLTAIATRYQSGAIQLGEGFEKFTKCDKMVSHMLKAGEQTGTLDAQLRLLVNTYKEQTTDAVETFLTAASLLALVIGATLIGFTFIGNMLPLIMLGPRLMDSTSRH